MMQRWDRLDRQKMPDGTGCESRISFLAIVAMVSIWHMHDWICTTKLDACTIVARGIMICVLCCMHDMSFAEGIATAVVNPRSYVRP